MERRRLSFSSPDKGVGRIIINLLVSTIMLFICVVAVLLNVSTDGPPARWLIALPFFVILVLNLRDTKRLAFTGWITPAGFEMQTFWLKTCYVPLAEFVRVESWLRRDQQIVFRNVMSVRVRRPFNTDSFLDDVLMANDQKYVDLANQEVRTYLLAAYAENPALFALPPDLNLQ